jgi:predicted transglutaminase-like cysteine proteinase
MRQRLAPVFFGTLCVVAATGLRAEPQTLAPASFMPVREPTSTPFGWINFCDRYPGECDNDAKSVAPVALSTTLWANLLRVNATANAAIVPTRDSDHWGIIDQWDYPLDGKGDCEDYAILKRKILSENGLSIHALLLTVVRDHDGDGHAVLTVSTDHGDFVLDNQTNSVLPWDRTGYRYVKRQSAQNPNLWLAIGEEGAIALTTAR